MILKVNDTANFNICMKLVINDEMGYIEILVLSHNKTNGKYYLKLFTADHYSEALQYYRKQEEFLI